MRNLATLAVITFLLLSFNDQLNAQKKMSFDLAAIRQTKHEVNGLNVSAFYHFNEHLAGGIEMNRFFPVTSKSDAEVTTSAWDFDLNFHYSIPVAHNLFFYPVTGFSHTSEKEVSKLPLGEAATDRFWSANTGAGLLWQKGKWGFHSEYLYTWGHLNQQFFLLGLSYELELGREKPKAHEE